MNLKGQLSLFARPRCVVPEPVQDPVRTVLPEEVRSMASAPHAVLSAASVVSPTPEWQNWPNKT
eukprot:5115786-Amphidinium_carterae.1